MLSLDRVPRVGTPRARRCLTAASLSVALVVSLASVLPAAAATKFRPRIGGAMGIVPIAGHQEIATGSNIPVVYHGGLVMRGLVTVHTIFWAPSGFHFNGPPSGSGPSYEQLIQKFLVDVAHDSGTAGNAFSVLNEFSDRSGHGGYNIAYNPAIDSIDATDPYPASSKQCASPSSITTCVTDLQLQQEIDKLIKAHAPSARGLHDVWFIFLPPDVDTCTSNAVCGTNAFAGYHSLANLAGGSVVYSPIPDPLIEFTFPPGSDPQGNPEAESAIDTVAHELVEAITDPEGAAWMDPNGFEVGDKCENGPQIGTPLGYAPNGSPYNQVINSDLYLIQTMWSNASKGCQQRSSSTSSPLPLATVDLNQFHSTIAGNIGTAKSGVAVAVLLVRAGVPVALAGARTRGSGSWGPVSLSSPSSGAVHGLGDDRDQIVIRYGTGGPKGDLIQTGSGGNPFTQSGWTGWSDLDTGYYVGHAGVLIAPCSQVGVLAVTVNGVPTAPPIEQCETESDLAILHTQTLGPGTSLRMSSQDNRAVSAVNSNGALVDLTIPLGEPHSVSAVGNSLVLFPPSGFPSCTANLEGQSVHCKGLVPGGRYTLTRRRTHSARHTSADASGTIFATGFHGRRGVEGGDLVTLTNSARRVLTTLHVAHLRVDIQGTQTTIRSGSCEAGDYYGPPLTGQPVSTAVGLGVAGTGTICPPTGDASGLSSGTIEQTDDRSGGTTRTVVPSFQTLAPAAGAVLYGKFVALAQIVVPGPNGSFVPTGGTVALTISRAASRRSVFHSSNVATARGVSVHPLPSGVYVAKWVLTDPAGDTRTISTRFVEA
jgi:hypothetical protein